MDEIVIDKDTWRARIIAQDDPGNPRKDWDHPGTVMFARHRRYDLGDGTDETRDLDGFMRTVSDYLSGDDLVAALVKHIVRTYAATVVLPLYLYDHSGLTISAGDNLTGAAPVTGNRLGWDTSLVGFIFDTPGLGAGQVEDFLRAQVVEFDQYLTGDVWGAVVEQCVTDHHTVTDFTGTVIREYDSRCWEEVTSVWGLYGDEYARQEAAQLLHDHCPDGVS